MPGFRLARSIWRWPANPDGIVSMTSPAANLARASDLIPIDDFAAAKMDEWLFWEQYSHEPYAAVCRFEMRYLGKQASDLDPEKLNRGYAALRRMEWHFAETPFLVANRFSLADISLLAYTRLAHQGGFDLAPFAALRRWIAACEGILGLPPATLCSGTSSHYPMRAST